MDGAHGLRRLAFLATVLCAVIASAQSHPGAQPVPTPPPAEPVPFFGPPGLPPSCATPIAPLGPTGPWEKGPKERHWLMRQADLRHSTTHGRAMGPGTPLRGTSWLNRPYSLSLDFGGLLMADRPAANVRANNDLIGAVGVGMEYDHYWAGQIRVGWSTPELLNTLQASVVATDTLMIGDFSLLYFPWGDSRLRPYWRLGVGLTDIEYTNDFGRRQHDMLFTVPIGAGLKYQLNPHVAWRLELVDNLALGQNETSTMNNFTITAGVEWRFGGSPSEAWGWRPRAGGW